MRRIAYVLPALLLTTACGLESPTWLPAGYAYHNEEYKAQPGPEAKNLGYDYSPQKNEYINTIWSDVARGLVDDLEAKTGLQPHTVYLEKLPQTNAFNLSLDNALREQFRARGYTLVDKPDGATHIKYQAYKPDDEGKRPLVVYNGDDPDERKEWNPADAREFVFVLSLLRDGNAFGEVRRTATIPAFGYVSGEGNIVPAPRAPEGKQAKENE